MLKYEHFSGEINIWDHFIHGLNKNVKLRCQWLDLISLSVQHWLITFTVIWHINVFKWYSWHQKMWNLSKSGFIHLKHCWWKTIFRNDFLVLFLWPPVICHLYWSKSMYPSDNKQKMWKTFFYNLDSSILKQLKIVLGVRSEVFEDCLLLIRYIEVRSSKCFLCSIVLTLTQLCLLANNLDTGG